MAVIASGILSQEAMRDRQLAGGKAAALAKLADEFPVPAFLVIPADAFDGDAVVETIAPDLAVHLARLGEGPYAVRSSGREEDGGQAAHAGQFQTVLNVPADQVLDAAFKVWRSGYSEDLAAYRRAQGLDDAPQPPAVIVQRMIIPFAAGVAFSADPVTGDRNVVAISATDGLADRLVGGEETGDQYWQGPDGLKKPSVFVGSAPILSADDCAAIAQLARRAEAYFGAPQDIEWAIDGDGLHLLQSRPITTLPILTDDSDDLIIWDNANIVESYPGIVSPLTFSFAQYVYGNVYMSLAQLLGVRKSILQKNSHVFANMLGQIDGRVYYNLLNWYRALALVPGFKTNRQAMERMMGADPLPDDLANSLAPSSNKLADRIRAQASLASVAFGLCWSAMRFGRIRQRFEHRLEAALKTPDSAIATLSITELLAAYRNLEAQLLNRWDAPLINDFLCMIAFAGSRKAVERWAGDEGLALHGDMLIGQGDIVSAEPARRIKQMGAIASEESELADGLVRGDLSVLEGHVRLKAAFADYLEKFGDRCTQELKLESVTLHDDPTPLAMAVGAAGKSEVGVKSAQEPGPVESADLDTVFAGRPFTRPLARWSMALAKGRVRDRENLRFERTRVFGRVRRIVLAMGEHWRRVGVLDHARDVFFVTIDDLLHAAEDGSGTALRSAAAVGKARMAEWAAKPDPANRMEQRGDQFTLSTRSSHEATLQSEHDTRSGLACCRGVVTAKVRVVSDPRTQALQPGEILVARHTDPGWIAVFANAAGVIAERGSLLSHSAIVAREMGVPCVVAVKDVANWLRTGDTVVLDGGAGTISRIARAASDD